MCSLFVFFKINGFGEFIIAFVTFILWSSIGSPFLFLWLFVLVNSFSHLWHFYHLPSWAVCLCCSRLLVSVNFSTYLSHLYCLTLWETCCLNFVKYFHIDIWNLHWQSFCVSWDYLFWWIPLFTFVLPNLMDFSFPWIPYSICNLNIV